MPPPDEEMYEASDEEDETKEARPLAPNYQDGVRSGWGASQEAIDSTSQYAQTFKTETKATIIKFLEETPYAAFRRHWVDLRMVGKRPFMCLQSVGRDCPLCAIGDKPGAVTAFNIALLSDDGVAAVKSWDCGVKLTQQLRTYHNDPKIGPLNKRTLYFAVSKTEATKRQQVSTMVNPVRERDLKEDWQVPPLDDAQIERLLENCYTADILEVKTRRELEEVAAEITGEDAPDEPDRRWGGA